MPTDGDPDPASAPERGQRRLKFVKPWLAASIRSLPRVLLAIVTPPLAVVSFGPEGFARARYPGDLKYGQFFEEVLGRHLTGVVSGALTVALSQKLAGLLPSVSDHRLGLLVVALALASVSLISWFERDRPLRACIFVLPIVLIPATPALAGLAGAWFPAVASPVWALTFGAVVLAVMTIVPDVRYEIGEHTAARVVYLIFLFLVPVAIMGAEHVKGQSPLLGKALLAAAPLLAFGALQAFAEQSDAPDGMDTTTFVLVGCLLIALLAACPRDLRLWFGFVGRAGWALTGLGSLFAVGCIAWTVATALRLTARLARAEAREGIEVMLIAEATQRDAEAQRRLREREQAEAEEIARLPEEGCERFLREGLPPSQRLAAQRISSERLAALAAGSCGEVGSIAWKELIERWCSARKPPLPVRVLLPAGLVHAGGPTFRRGYFNSRLLCYQPGAYEGENDFTLLVAAVRNEVVDQAERNRLHAALVERAGLWWRRGGTFTSGEQVHDFTRDRDAVCEILATAGPDVDEEVLRQLASIRDPSYAWTETDDTEHLSAYGDETFVTERKAKCTGTIECDDLRRLARTALRLKSKLRGEAEQT